MNTIELQAFIFKDKLTRRELKTYNPQIKKRYRVQVFRNHSFEMVEHTIGAYLDYAQLGITFIYGGYDDSFSFAELDDSVDMVLIWIDTNRYTSTNIDEFLAQRIQSLMGRFSAPVLLIPFGQALQLPNPHVRIFSMKELADELGEQFTDRRAETVTGTALSAKALMQVSRELGLRYFPALLRPALKAIVVDLDNTLYVGVLGEDGADGVCMTEGHAKLQRKLKSLAEKGFFLCIASKNQLEDVEHLFKQRQDFPLKGSDFTKICASWDSKASSITEIAGFLNIHPESMVFIDDNIGELTSVSMEHPSIKPIHAQEDGAKTAAILENFPGLLKEGSGKEDGLRKQDVQANDQRRTLQNSLSMEDYICSLELKLTFSANHLEDAERIYELSNKTNQFIFNYARYKLAEVQSRLTDRRYCVVTISLSDKLSDSGIVGLCVGQNLNDHIEIEEFFLSCRALGRGIDDIMVLGAIQSIVTHLGGKQLKVQFQEGERNEPARRFVAEHLAAYVNEAHPFSYTIPKNLVTLFED